MKHHPSSIIPACPAGRHHPLTLGFSPCPNDCFIFDALLHGKTDTEELKFNPIIEDVEALNRRAVQGKRKKAKDKSLDITKLSFFAYAQVQKNYSLLDSGAAVGFSVGPLIISKKNIFPLSLRRGTRGEAVAIPGKNTTANFLFSLAFPHLKNKTEVLFSKIEDAVLNEEYDLGVIIHESRFTYKQKGLKKVIDLGEWWEEKYKCPLSLGGIFVKKSFPKEIKRKINRVIRRSVEFALANPESSKMFVKKHSQELDDEVIKQHINLYVNKFSVSLGEEGKKAVDSFLKEAEKKTRWLNKYL